MVHTFTAENFQTEVMESKIPVFVDFYADWCGPCKMMAPVLARLADTYEGRIKIGKVNVDDDPELAERFAVMSIPNMVLIKDGAEVDRQIGAVQPAVLAKKFDRILS